MLVKLVKMEPKVVIDYYTLSTKMERFSLQFAEPRLYHKKKVLYISIGCASSELRSPECWGRQQYPSYLEEYSPELVIVALIDVKFLHNEKCSEVRKNTYRKYETYIFQKNIDYDDILDGINKIWTINPEIEIIVEDFSCQNIVRYSISDGKIVSKLEENAKGKIICGYNKELKSKLLDTLSCDIPHTCLCNHLGELVK